MKPRSSEIFDLLRSLHAAPDDVLFTEVEAALFLSVSVSTLKAWRYKRSSLAPVPRRFGRAIRYTKRDLLRIYKEHHD